MMVVINNEICLLQGNFPWYVNRMAQSTVTDKFQTTIPLEVRRALKLSPRQKVAYEVRPDGSAVMRPVARLDDLFGSLPLHKPVASTREEKQAARAAMAREAAGEGLK
jgi:bifunctional DNA-binding transcriptional regulator/antitoxin component of YhaV-PrlF toxin-antitoxin module